MNTSQVGRPSRNGSPRAQPPQESKPQHMNHKIIYGKVLIGIMLIKFLFTWILGLTPDPLLTGINLVVGCLGVVLLMWGRKDSRNRNYQEQRREFLPSEVE